MNRALGISCVALLLLTSCQMGAPKATSSAKPNETKAVTGLTSDMRQITFGGLRSGEGYFSPDGKRMIFQSERESGNPFYQIYVMDLQSGETNRVSPGYGKTTCSWLHPDGERALFASSHLDPKARAKQKKELQARVKGPQKRYAWDYDEHYDIFESSLKAGKLTRLTKEKGYDAEGSYSPDGQWIVFASNRTAYSETLSPEDSKLFAQDPAYMMEIYIMKADGREVKRLTHSPGYDGGPFFSPDGKRITWRRFAPSGHMAEVYTMNVDGSDQKQITQLKAMSWAPFYHPSGDYLIFTTNIHGYQNFELYIVDTEGKRTPVRVTDLEGFDGLPVFSPDGQSLAWSRKGPGGDSQIYLAKWNDALARQSLGLGAATKPAPVPAVEPKPEIDVTDNQTWIRYLASDALEGRATGGAQEAEYMTRIEGYFKSIGLKPLGKSYAFPFGFSSGVSVGSNNQFSLNSQNYKVGEDWQPLAQSKAGSFKAKDFVFAGYGLVAPADKNLAAYDSYRGLNVKKKWVVIFRYVPEKLPAEQRVHLQRYSRLEHKIMMARERGAAGLILVSGPNSGAKSDLIPLQFERGAGEPSLPVISVSNALAEKLLESTQKKLPDLQTELDSGKEIEGFALTDLKLATKIDLNTSKGKARNTLALIETPRAKHTVIFGAHGDHLGKGYSESSLLRDRNSEGIHHGADDNASGVAAVLELAQYFSQPEIRKTLKTNMIFAIWSGEELGDLGSHAFLKQWPQAKRKKVSAYINMDMVGRYKDKLIIQGLGSSPDWPQVIEKANVNSGLTILTQADPYLPTDALSFYMSGIPVLSFFTGAHTDYHTPSDTEDKINYADLVKIENLIARVGTELATSGKALKYERIERKELETTGGRRFRIFLGTIPDYASEGVKGVKISGVIKGGPAEQAGLKGGDVIVGLSGFNIQNIHDYVYSLEAVKPGQATKISILREGSKLDLDITPVARE